MTSSAHETRIYPLKHPLVQAFGVFLKRARKRELLSTMDMAIKLEMSHSLYRLVESGSALLQPVKTHSLITTLPSSKIEFRALASLLVTFQALGESRMSAANMNTVIERTREVLRVDEGLTILSKALDSVWPTWLTEEDGLTSPRAGELLEQSGMLTAVAKFLAHGREPALAPDSQSAHAWASDLIHNTPPLYLDIISNVVGGLKGFAPQIDADHLSRWERNHRGRFRTLYAVINQSFRILLDTYDEFDWSFIADAYFERLTIVSLMEDRRRERASFDKLLSKIKSENWFPRRSNFHIEDDELIQLHFAHEKKGTIKRNDFIRLLGKDYFLGDDFINAWIYEILPLDHSQSMNLTHHVVFKDNRSPTKDDHGTSYNGIHCTWSETEEWIDRLRTFLSGEESKNVG